VSQDLLKIIMEVTMREDIDEALTLMLGEYISRRISECREEIRHEMDYAMWGALLDELEELEKRLRQLKWKPKNS